MKKRRPSGWARLWIVILVPVFVFASLGAVTLKNERWYGVCNWSGCPGYPVQPTGEDWWAADSDIMASERYKTNPAYREAVDEGIRYERDRREGLTRDHYFRFGLGIFFAFVGCVIGFALAMLAKSAAIWVWRCFRPQPD